MKYKFIPKMLPAIATKATATVTMLSTYSTTSISAGRAALLHKHRKFNPCVLPMFLIMVGNSVKTLLLADTHQVRRRARLHMRRMMIALCKMAVDPP